MYPSNEPPCATSSSMRFSSSKIFQKKNSGSSSYPSTSFTKSSFSHVCFQSNSPKLVVSGPLLAKAHRRWRSSKLATWKLLDTSGKKGMNSELADSSHHFFRQWTKHHSWVWNLGVGKAFVYFPRRHPGTLWETKPDNKNESSRTNIQTSKHPTQHLTHFSHFLLAHLVLAVARDFNQSWCTTIICEAKSSHLGNMISWKIPHFEWEMLHLPSW